MSSSEERLASLISKCKSSSDVDAKVDALSKLQAEFEAGVELFDVDGLISALKACLRTPNQHLSTATLSAILPLFPLLVQHTSSPPSVSSSTDSAILRQALNAFLPAGGVIERLGDNREKAREKAKDVLLAIGTVVFKTNSVSPPSSFRGKDGKGVETPLQIYERCLREQGLASKSWRVREQSILTLVQLRRSHSLFPLRPFLPPLVDALEDGDGAVRECARQSVVEIFTGQGVTDAARTDLKKEMTKKGVRKTIVDSVLIKLLSGGGRLTPSGDNVDSKEDSRPSIFTARKPTAPFMPTTGRSHGAVPDLDAPTGARSPDINSGDADVTPVYVGLVVLSQIHTKLWQIASARDLENEFLSMLPYFEGKETEHNWLAREKSVIRIRGMLKGDAHSRYPETFIAGLKNGVLEGTLKALASLRTTVSASTCSLYSDLVVSLASGLDPFVETLLMPLLRMAGFTKKIIAAQSQEVVDAILIHTSCHPRQTLPLLWGCVQDKTVQARVFAAGHVKTFLDHHGMRSKHSIESSGGVDLLDKCIRKGLADPNPGVREKARLSFWSFEAIWKDRGFAILESLDAPARKQLQNVCPVPLDELGLPKSSTTPANKKSSIAAAIAASRAKAKQIATAPPTLRHQATAASHAQAARATSPAPNKRPISPIITTPRRSSPSPRAGSPSSSPRPSTLRKSTNVAVAGLERQRTRSPLSSSPSPPPSPTNATHRRRTSSPLITQSLARPVVQQNNDSSHPPGPGSYLNSRTMSSLRTTVLSTPVSNQIGPSKHGVPIDPEETLLMATSIPLPSESDQTDDDESVNLMTFSAPWELSHPPSQSETSSGSTPSSRIGRIPPSVVEDALRARAAQAESAAAQLLELVDPDDDNHLSPIPPSLLPSNGATPKPSSRASNGPPITPVNQSSAVMREAALFQDSPVYNGAPPSIFELIEERKHQTGWWLKRMSIIDQGATVNTDVAQRVQELEEYTTALEKGIADLSVLRKLTLLCYRNPCHAPMSPPMSPSLPKARGANGVLMSPASPSPYTTYPGKSGPPVMMGDIWEGGTRAEKLFNALCTFLHPNKDKDLLEHGLFVLWEMLPHLDGRDSDIFALLLRLRYAQDFNVDEGTLTIRDAQVELMNERNYTLYGLSTMDLCLRAFLAQPIPSQASHDAKLRAHAFGLVTMAKFIIRLPPDILEEELPKMKQTLTEAYLNSAAMVRQAATTAITAAQVILQDETHLFALLEPLPDDKKNLLTYFFEKNHARGVVERVGEGPGTSGMENLSKDMDRLDQRISTPPSHRVP